MKLESQRKEKDFANVNFLSKSNLTPEEEIKLVKLVGQKCLVDCYLDGMKCKVLWDTGTEVALISQMWLNENFPGKEIKNVSELLGQELFLKVANNSKLEYLGYTEIVLRISDHSELLMVPFLVTEEEVNMPVIGYNVIEEIVKGEIQMNKPNIVNVIETLLCDVSNKKVESLVNLIQNKVSCIEPESIGDVKVGNKDIVIPKGRNLKMRCISQCRPVNEDIPVIFQPNLNLDLESGLVIGEGVMLIERGKTSRFLVPVSNTSGCDIILKARTQVGVIVPVASVIPCPMESQLNCINNDEDIVTEERNGDFRPDDPETKDKSFNDEEWLSHMKLDYLSVSQQRKVKEMLRKESDVFSKSSSDIGEMKGLDMKINLKDNDPVKRAYTSKPLYKEVKEYVEDLLASGWGQKSYSSYSSPMICVRKKNGTLRLCIDYRKLNSKTIPDSQPIPKVQDILNSLGGNRWFSTLDMSKTYHQGFIHENSRPLTAFATPWSLLEWIRIPFGLMNAPPVFQRYMNECLAGLRDVICIPYLGDILAYSKTFDDHLEDVQMVLKRLREHGIKLNFKKCNLFRKEAQYLGHILSEDGYRVEGANDEVIDRLKEAPKSVSELRSLLGFIGYFRSFIQDFSRKAKLLYDLLCKDKEKGKSKKKSLQRASNDKIVWLQEHQAIVDSLLELLKIPPVMAHPDFSIPFILHCDASETGFGAVLYQVQGGKLRVVSYASRTLTPAERNCYFHSGKLEFLALKWAVTEKFNDFLYYAPSFTIYSDCNPLTYILSSAKLNATTIRWVGDMANYNFNVKYRPGKLSTDCDYLSRHPVDITNSMDLCNEEITSDTIGAVVAGSKQKGKFAAFNSVMVPEFGKLAISQLSPHDVRAEQKKDEILGDIIRWVENRKYPDKETK